MDYSFGNVLVLAILSSFKLHSELMHGNIYQGIQHNN